MELVKLMSIIRGRHGFSVSWINGLLIHISNATCRWRSKRAKGLMLLTTQAADADFARRDLHYVIRSKQRLWRKIQDLVYAQTQLDTNMLNKGRRRALILL